ncbi:thiamine biosynthesis protein ThiJ [Desulfuribacillus stibiiarsenatis]|uniref:Thiamine biosynthesis protein ThiJ n=1 Tax=Desulfuribacillus stibiiarsenatis TaxID=1390249 RepID=A0A1E5L5F7_9FIRM|nr:DJ-1/PfpI family protein [Desulfuribacillus stibiiarsenatis]OEH85351.1 thiamine biosynthesis protein ThiJ [Desulfuribacillus stibiiarsenatis]
MRIAFVLFHGMTMLDFIGFYDCVTRLKTMGFIKDLSWDTCALTPTVRDDRGIEMKIDKQNADLSEYDMIFIPGGMATRQLIHDETHIEWLKKARYVRYIVSVCTGSLLLGAADILRGKRATTHPNAYSLLESYDVVVNKKRIVFEDNIITAGGVAASIDLGLFICELLAGYDARSVIQKQMDYPYVYQGI